MDWDQRYRENDTPWERGEPAPPLMEFLEKERMAGRVLVPGCGLGHDVRYLAAHGCEVLGIDISPLALSQANLRPAPPAAAPLSYALCDFLDPKNELPDSSFDWIFEHTCFCAIDRSLRAAYVEAAARVLKPKGRLLAIFFTDLESEDGPPYSSTRDEIASLFSRQFSIARLWRPSKFFAGRENEESMYLLDKR